MRRGTAVLCAARGAPLSGGAPVLKVLVLTMTPNGGAMTTALRELGYHPYVFENAIRQGNVMTHAREWRDVLLRRKPLSLEILAAAPSASPRRASSEASDLSPPSPSASASAPQHSEESRSYFDALVGPPATLAYESILDGCPRSTRVILVEEPDKVAWELEYEQTLGPVMEQTRRRARLISTMADVHQLLYTMTDLRHAVSEKKDDLARSATALKASTRRAAPSAAAAFKVGALQASALKLGAALDLFEAEVKATVPRDRLLVYRLGEGWGPLCDFLGVPVPTRPSSAAATTSIPGAAADASREPLPFPSTSSGAEVLADLLERVHGADRMTAFFVLVVGSLVAVLCVAFGTGPKYLFQRFSARYRAALTPYVEEHKDDRSVTLRQLLIQSKKVTLDFEDELRSEGGVVADVKNAWHALVDPVGARQRHQLKLEAAATPPHTPTGGDGRASRE